MAEAPSIYHASLLQSQAETLATGQGQGGPSGPEAHREQVALQSQQQALEVLASQQGSAAVQHQEGHSLGLFGCVEAPFGPHCWQLAAREGPRSGGPSFAGAASRGAAGGALAVCCYRAKWTKEDKARRLEELVQKQSQASTSCPVALVAGAAASRGGPESCRGTLTGGCPSLWLGSGCQEESQAVLRARTWAAMGAVSKSGQALLQIAASSALQISA